MTTPDDWESEAYREPRRDRSAVESLMFTIKDGFAFGELGRRGIDAVGDELLEKGSGLQLLPHHTDEETPRGGTGTGSLNLTALKLREKSTTG